MAAKRNEQHHKGNNIKTRKISDLGTQTSTSTLLLEHMTSR